jgi:putative ABC transport system permease protein
MTRSRTARRCYTLALRAFPPRHRAGYATEMIDAFERELDARARDRGRAAALRFAVAASLNAVGEGLGERRRYHRSGLAPARSLTPGAFARDLMHAARSLAKSRTFTFVCAASLGLGMATIIAIVIFLRAILSPPAAINPDGLVELLVLPQGPLRAQTGDWAIDTWSYPDFTDVRDANTGVTVTGWTIGDSLLHVTGDDDGAVRVASMYVSPDYFTTLGVALARGLGFSGVGHDVPAAPPVVVVSHRLWQLRLGSDPEVIGRTIAVNRVDHVVVGVAPESFRRHLSPEESPGIQLWMPLAQHPRLDPQAPDSLRFKRDTDWIRVLGRLSPATTREQAGAAVASIMTGLAARYPDSNEHTSATVEPYAAMGARSAPDIARVKAVFIGMSGMVLLIVCLNVSGMVLVRSATRERELAVRLAIGASRGRLLQYLLAEAVVLAFLGGGLACSLLFGVPLALAWYFDELAVALEVLRPDGWMLTVCVGLCFATSLVFGLLPAIRFSRPSLVTALKDEVGGGGRRIGRLHRITAAIQAGLAVPFLVISGVKIDQVRTTALADLGFEERGFFATPLNLTEAAEAGKDATFLLRSAREHLGRAAGVEAVTVADGIPLDFDYRILRIWREGDTRVVPAHTTRVADGYFETLQIPRIRGRGITRDDRAGAEPVVVLSEPLAAQLFPGEDPLGQRLSFSVDDHTPQGSTVVGVTADVVTSQMGTARPQMYLPLAQHPAPRVLLIARGSASEASMASAFKNAVVDVDRDFMPSRLITGERLVQRSMEDLATHSFVAGVGAGIALTLAALGVYGVVGFMVATRTREIGVRMALGATRRRVLGSVLVDAARIALPGVVVGVVLGMVLVRQTGGFEAWYPLGGVEPVIYLFAAAVAMGVAMLAGVPSARRAARVDPLLAMRSE